MSIDPCYVLFTVAKFSAWGEIVDLAEGICSGEWKELDDLGYEGRRSGGEEWREIRCRGREGGWEAGGVKPKSCGSKLFHMKFCCGLNAISDCAICSWHETNLSQSNNSYFAFCIKTESSEETYCENLETQIYWRLKTATHFYCDFRNVLKNARLPVYAHFMLSVCPLLGFCYRTAA